MGVPIPRGLAPWDHLGTMDLRHRAQLERVVQLPGPLHRSAGDRMVAGVCGGVGAGVGVDPTVLRLSLVVLTIANGSGALAYLTALALLPGERPTAPADARPPSGERAVGVALVAIGLLLLYGHLDLLLPAEIVWPSAIAAFGFALVWARTDASDRTRGLLLRSVGGGLLVVAGLGGLFAAGGALSLVGQLGLAVVATGLGVAVLLGPWIVRLLRDLSDERRERIRSEERSEIAAHLHDSVLQTLALIQRADGPGRARTLARRQERELRAWLYDDRPPEGAGAALDLSAALDRVVTEVEDRHDVEVELVMVGTCPLEPRLDALVAAIREAAHNAARHAGVGDVSVYVEVEAERVEAFVRDRGKGFDPGAVAAGRLGIKESIVGRMARHGGKAEVHAAPGEGTEVHLQIARTPDAPEAER